MRKRWLEIRMGEEREKTFILGLFLNRGVQRDFDT